MKAYTNGATNLPSSTKSQIDCAVKKQLGYILGNTGRSFVVGYGTNPPQRPHHRASSCPPLGVQCTWDYFNNPGPNPHTLYGAVVGGPGSADDYIDARNDYIKNEVATDYNAGFTGALAAAKQGLTCAAKMDSEDLPDQQPADSAGQVDDQALLPDQQPADPSVPEVQPPSDSALPPAILQPGPPAEIVPITTPAPGM